jgi:hypothetical protein
MLAELPLLERCAITSLWMWCDSAAGRQAVVRDFSRVCDVRCAALAVNGFADLIGVMLAAPRRSIMRHSPFCDCSGGDKAAFTYVIAAATVGNREDAMCFALVLMQPSATWQAVQLARGVGLDLLGLCRHPPILTCQPRLDPKKEKTMRFYLIAALTTTALTTLR